MAVEQAALEALAARDRELLQELLLGASPRLPGREGPRVGARLRGPAAPRARPAARRRGDPASASSWRFTLHHGRRVPGHQPSPVRARRRCSRAGRELFFVGDEFQSIYGFRHADVEVFRERREQVGRRARADAELPLAARGARRRSTTSSRLDFGETFQPLDAAGRFADPAFGAAVELLVTDKASYADTGTHWRQAEARHIATRVRDLVDTGEAAPGEIVLLFAAGTDARLYEEELRALGLPTSARRAATTTTSSRWSTCSRTCACCTTVTTTRRS